MTFSYKKYFLSAAIAYFVGCSSLHAYEKHNTASMLYLVASYVENTSPANKKEHNKAIIQKVIQYFKNHEEINTDLLQELYLALGLQPDDFEDDPSIILQKILMQLGAKPNISFNYEINKYHDLGPKGQSYYKNEKKTHFITLEPQNKKYIQHQLNALIQELNKEVDSFEYVKLIQIIEQHYAIPQPLQDEFFTIVTRYLILRAEIKKLLKKKHKKKYTKNKNTLENKINTKKEEKLQINKQLKQICIKCNLTYNEIKFLLDSQQGIRIDHDTGDLLTTVDTISTQHLETFGNYLLIYIDHNEDPEEEENSDADKRIHKSSKKNTLNKNPYINEEISIKNYRTQQEAVSELVQYLKIITDPETEEEIYIVYYQVYNKKKDRYEYYKCTPDGFKRIREKTFFAQSKSKNVHFLVYEKVDVQSFYYPIPWIDQKTLEQLRSMLLGATLAFIIVAFMQLGDEPVIQFRPWQQNTSKRYTRTYKNSSINRNQRIKGEGMPTLTNSCYWNAPIQVLRFLYRPFLTAPEVPADIKKAFNTLFKSMDKGINNNSGASYGEVIDARNIIASYKNFEGEGASGSSQLEQQDPHDFFKTLTQAIESKARHGFEAFPINIKQESKIELKYAIKYKENEITETRPRENLLDIFFPLDLPTDQDNISVKELIDMFARVENLNGYVEWSELWKKVRESNTNLAEDAPLPSNNLIAYIVIQEYNEVTKELDELISKKENTSKEDIINKLIKEGEQILNTKKVDWLQNLQTSHKNTKTYDGIQLTADNDRTGIVKKCMDFLTKELKNKQISEIPALALKKSKNMNNDPTDKLFVPFVLESLKACLVNLGILGSREKIDRLEMLFEKLLSMDDVFTDENKTKLINPKKLEKDAISFFTKEGFDGKSVIEQLKDKGITFNTGKDPIRLKYTGKKKLTPKFLTNTKNETFAFQLKRFSNVYDLNKNNIKVTDAMEIKVDKKYLNNEKESLTLQLHGVILHSGVSRDNGHYRAYIKNKGKWIMFNDQTVSYGKNNNDITEEEVIGAIKGTPQTFSDGLTHSENAYLLFYKKIPPS